MEYRRKKIDRGWYEYRGYSIISITFQPSTYVKWKVIEGNYETGRIVHYSPSLAESTRWIDKKLDEKEEKIERHKTVLLPVKVPQGDYCWDFDRRICEHFDNEGGTPYCLLIRYCQKQDKEGRVLKLKKCKELKEDKCQKSAT